MILHQKDVIMSEQDTQRTTFIKIHFFTMRKISCKVYYIPSSSSLRYGNGFLFLGYGIYFDTDMMIST